MVVKFDVLVVVVAGDRIIHQFVNDDVADQNLAVARTGRSGRHRIKRAGSVRPATQRNAVGLRLELHRIQNAAVVRLDEINRRARTVGPETELRLIE